MSSTDYCIDQQEKKHPKTTPGGKKHQNDLQNKQKRFPQKMQETHLTLKDRILGCKGSENIKT